MKNDISKEIDLNAILEGPQESVPQQVQEASAEVLADFAEIVEEWSYRLPKGYPTMVDGKFTEYEEVKILNEIMEEKFGESLPLPANNVVKPTTIINEGATEDNSEVLCMYFCCKEVTDPIIEGCKTYLTNLKKSPGKPKKMLVMPSGLTAKNLGGSGATALQKLLADYNAGKPNINEFVNAITSAQYIKSNYGVPIAANQLDRGPGFDKFKQAAVGLISRTMGIDLRTEPDKWSPADIFIYNQDAPRNIDTLAKDNKTTIYDINKLFTESITSTSGKIVGISLKKSKAQGGKALSYRKTLTKDKFELASDITVEAKEERSCLYLSSMSTSQAKSGKKLISNSDKFGYIAEIAVNQKLNKDTAWTAVTNSAATTIKKTIVNLLKQCSVENKLDTKAKQAKSKTYQQMLELGDKILKQKSQDAAKKFARTFFKSVKDANIVYDKSYDGLVTSFKTSKKSKAVKLCGNAKKNFLAALDSQQYTIKDVTTPEVDNTVLRSYKKASCYLLATWFLTGSKTGGLKMPSGFTAIAKQKDPFVAMTAYAIGQAGISPYFIKVKGAGDIVSKLNQPAAADYMGGDGMVEVSKNKAVLIVDSENAAGFAVIMELEVRKVKGASKKYKVTLDFRFAGEAINIEVSEIH